MFGLPPTKFPSVEALVPGVMVIWNRALETQLGSDEVTSVGDSLMGSMLAHGGKAAICKPKRGSPGAKSDGPLLLDLPAPRRLRNKYPLFQSLQSVVFC